MYMHVYVRTHIHVRTCLEEIMYTASCHHILLCIHAFQACVHVMCQHACHMPMHHLRAYNHICMYFYIHVYYTYSETSLIRYSMGSENNVGLGGCWIME